MIQYAQQLNNGKSLQVLGERIRIARKGKKLSQEKLAEKTEMAVSYIGGIERGQYNPSLKKLCAIADALGVDVSVLVHGLKARDIVE
jgi:transcriptional regulator with XRE-family HTH domain